MEGQSMIGGLKSLRDYQHSIAVDAALILKRLKIVYLAMEVRTGKTATALQVAKLVGAEKVLFVTKKKAIESIQSDHNTFGFDFDLTVINYESLHLIDGNFNLVVLDEHHRNAAYPKPNKSAKDIKKRFGHLRMIFLSGTPFPESYSQVYHSFWVSNYSPFDYANFYKWAKDYVNVKVRDFGYAKVNDYSSADYSKIKPIIDRYMITFTQSDAGFTSTVNERVLICNMKPITYKLINRLKEDKIYQGKNDVIIADTAVKLQNKIHQLSSGTCILESGNTAIIDPSKGEFIRDRFKGDKIGIFYKFKAELDILKSVFKENLTTDLTEFNTTSKNIALQIVSGREGISLAKAKYLVYFNIDFSAVSYWQSRDRLTTMQRTENDVFWIFSDRGIEKKIYKAVMSKKNYTLQLFKRDYEFSK